MTTYRVGLAAGVLAAALALAACGSSSTGAGGNATDTAPTTTSAGGSSTGGGSAPASGAISCDGAGNLKVDGSTAQANAIAAWQKAYSKACGHAWTYGGGGSGQGITDFIGNKVDFAGSDAALNADAGEVDKASKACGSPAINLPMVTGPIAVAFKLNGVKDLTLTSSTIAKIFTGKVKEWNDPAIAGENKGANLPSTKITVFFRSDQSGTTQNFETYLSKAAPADYTATPSKTWVGTGQGKNGSQGIQQALTTTEGGIGYDELSYTGGLTLAKVDNGAGGVALTAESAGKAVASAKPAPNTSTGDLTLELDYATNAPGAYPIILVTYEIVCTKYKNPAVGAAVKSFLTYTSSDAGQSILTGIGSAPLPSSVLTKVQTAVAGIS